jgi:hypothetical protein
MKQEAVSGFLVQSMESVGARPAGFHEEVFNVGGRHRDLKKSSMNI